MNPKLRVLHIAHSNPHQFVTRSRGNDTAWAGFLGFIAGIIVGIAVIGSQL